VRVYVVACMRARKTENEREREGRSRERVEVSFSFFEHGLFPFLNILFLC